jgi:hypothetical protein
VTYEKKDKSKEFERALKKKGIDFKPEIPKSYSVEEKIKTREEALKKLDKENTPPPILAGKSKKNSKEEKNIKNIGDNNPKLLAQLFREILEEDPEWKMLKKELKK